MGTLKSSEKSNSDLIFDFIEKNEVVELFNLLEADKDDNLKVKLMKIRNLRGLPLLTYCARKNNFMALEIICEQSRHSEESSESFS